MPQTTHGRFRKVPARLAGSYEESRSDPDLISTRDGIALVSARVDELLATMDAGESGELWKQARRAFREFQRELRQQGDIQTPLQELEAALEKGAREAEAWAEIDRNMKTIARLAETERRRVVDAQKMITPSELNMLMRGLEEAVTRNVSDQDTRTAISRDMQKALDTL